MLCADVSYGTQDTDFSIVARSSDSTSKRAKILKDSQVESDRSYKFPGQPVCLEQGASIPVRDCGMAIFVSLTTSGRNYNPEMECTPVREVGKSTSSLNLRGKKSDRKSVV